MPLLNVFSSAPPPADRAGALGTLSKLVARAFDKPEEWVMVSLTPRADMLFGGSAAPCCYAELKNVGQLSPGRIAELSGIFCSALAAALSVPPERVYLEFTNADGAMWGWNGETFA